MTQTAKIVFTADDADLARKIQQQESHIARLEKRLDSAGKAGARGGKQTASAWNEGAAAVGKVFATVAGIGGVMQGVQVALGAIRAEYEAMARRQSAAALEARSFGEVVRETKTNFVADETISSGEQLEQEILKIAEATRTDPKQVAQVMGSALSAKGALSNRTASDAVTEAFRLLPGNAAAAEQLSTRAMDISQATGNTDIKQILGFLVNLQASSRVTSLDKLGKAAIPAITSFAGRGGSVEKGGELFATLNQLMADAEGQQTATSMISLGEQLAKFVPKATGKDDHGKFSIPEAQRAAFEAAKTDDERIAVMQQSPDLRRAFLAQASFEQKAKTPIRRILEAEQLAMDTQRQVEQNVAPVDAAQAKLFDQKVAELEGGKFQGGLTLEQQSQANISGGRLSQSLGQRIGAARKVLEDTFNEVDLPGLDSRARGVRLGFFETAVARGEEPEAAAAQVLSDVQSKLDDPLQRFLGKFFPSDAKADSELLQKQVSALEQTAKTNEELLRIEQQRQGAPQPVKVETPSTLPNKGPRTVAAASFSSN